MTRSLAKVLPIKPPKELAQLFSDPPLALNEKQEDYERLFAAIAAAAKPADAIAWVFVRDFTDLSWEIQRERNLKTQIITSAEQDVVARQLEPSSHLDTDSPRWKIVPHPDAGRGLKLARQWANDPEARPAIEKELADEDCEPADILSGALLGEASQIDAIDKRIATFELRRMATLRAIEQYSESLARRLKVASSEIIDGEFTEAAE